jgi:hypothetical protein
MSVWRRAILSAIAVAVFAFSWLFRFNDPGGSFAGLTDDHFFYLVRGWQILFGDLPVRDFVDHGAPLYYYVGAAVQLLFGRGTLSEVVFSVTVLSCCAALTFWLCTEASGWMAAGLAGAAFHILLEPRFYNYPKILVYVLAIPLLWRFIERPTSRLAAWIAVVSVVGFLLRHDHGVFVGLGMALALLLVVRRMDRTAWLTQLGVYAGVSCLLLLPYLAFIELNGGVVSYFQQASAWAERDRDRAPVVWPGLFDNPDGVSDAARSGSMPGRAVAVVRDNIVAWTFYAELILPVLALAAVWLSRDGFRPSWPRAREKLTVVAVLALMLDAGFLRSPLGARLADPSVPLAILVAWLRTVLPRLAVGGGGWRLRPGGSGVVARATLAVAAAPVAFTLVAGMTHDLYRRLDKAALTERWGKSFERVGTVSAQLRRDWQLPSWVDRPQRPELIDLSMYVNACTAPTDRVLVQAYVPQVLALAQRAFAGGHADLRPGFFSTEAAQRLTLARLQARPVPIVLLESGDALKNFRQSFPLIVAYLDARYREAGMHVFDGRFGTTLFVRKDLTPSGEYAPLGWPCFGSGVVGLR